jgi:hypothetical protein
LGIEIRKKSRSMRSTYASQHQIAWHASHCSTSIERIYSIHCARARLLKQMLNAACMSVKKDPHIYTGYP